MRSFFSEILSDVNGACVRRVRCVLERAPWGPDLLWKSFCS
jgi:hypothetical protein